MEATTMLDYVRTHTESMLNTPYNAVDALVFSTMVYQRMPQCVPTIQRNGHEQAQLKNHLQQFNIAHPLQSFRRVLHPPLRGVPLRDVTLALKPEDFGYETGYAGVADPSLTQQLFQSVMLSPRFSDIEACAYLERFSKQETMQFAAVTFRLPDETLLVAYRGTDATFTGWKEDLYLACDYPVPSQEQAVAYLRYIAQHWQGNIVLAGHSKGGNLALYAATECGKEIQQRISHIYCFDGPGLPLEVTHSSRYKAIRERISLVVPNSSVVGMILHHTCPINIVQCDRNGIMQHLAYSWLIEDDRFKLVPELAKSSIEFHQSLNDLLEEIKVDERRQTIDAAFAVLESSKSNDVMHLTQRGFRSVPAMMSAFAGIDAQHRNTILKVVMILAKASLPLPLPTPSLHTQQPVQADETIAK